MKFSEYIERRKGMRLLANADVSEGMRYHLEHGIPLHENVYRIYSRAWYDLVAEARNLYESELLALNDDDADLVETDAGEVAEYNGKKVRLDSPFPIKERLDEAEYHGKKVKTGKPFRTPGENKKFAVYVKTKSGRVKKVRFGDPNLTVKNDNPARAKSFRARHKCSEKKDREKAGYWACRIGRYAKSVGLKSSRSW